MAIRATSRIRKMEILQFTLLASELVMRGRMPFFAVNSNRFGKPWEMEINYGWDGHKDIRTERFEGPSRKIFREYLNELLHEKLLTRIITKDKRSKYYSITPLGIIALIKSEMFFDGIKYRYPENSFVIFVLQIFAQQNVKPYKSQILKNKKFVNSDTTLWKDLTSWSPMSIREAIAHVFTNVDISHERIGKEHEWYEMEYFITNGFPGANKINLCDFNLINDDFITVRELDAPSTYRGDPQYVESSEHLKLDIEQFHHYLSNLMICSLVYDSAMLHYDLVKRRNEKKISSKTESIKTTADEIQEDMKKTPDYFLEILFLFSKHISQITEDQFSLTSSFQKNLTKIQYQTLEN